MNTLTKTEKPVMESRPVSRMEYITPRCDIWEDKDGYMLEAEMPGVSKEGLEVLLEGHDLVILGRRKEVECKDAEWLFRESKPVSYRREFVLDPSIDTSKISARMDNGILHLRLPKAESQKPRKITVS